MREVLSRVACAAQPPGRRWFWALLALGPCLVVGLPVVRHPGYELFALLTLWVGLLGITVGLQFSRTAEPADLAAWAGAAAVLLVATTPAIAAAVAVTALTSPCDPSFGFEWYAPLVVPTALLSSAAGLAIARASARRWVRAGLGGVLILASALATASTIVFGPHVYAYNHFGGYLPGPLYDEHLVLPGALGWFRLATLLLALGLFGVAAAGLRSVRALLPLAGFLLVEGLGTQLGFRVTDAALARALGGLRTTAHVALHYPQELPPAQVDQLAKDAEFRAAQLTAFFGAAPPERVIVWWYPSRARKRELVGAASTQFAKPWRREVHVNAAALPHPVLKHELAHAFAAAWGRAPFGITSSWGGLWPHMAIVEGAAVAADDRVDELSLHEWAAAMKRQGLLPDVAQLMTDQGFYAAPPARAYATAGSFLAWLQQQRGAAAVRALYRDGDWLAATGSTLAALAHDYATFLDGVPLDPQAVSLAFPRFRQGSVFERACVREVAALDAEADALETDAPERALPLVERIARLQPGEHDYQLARAALLRRLGRTAQAAGVLDAALAGLAERPAAWAEVAAARLHLALDERDDATARALLEDLRQLDLPPALDRTARVRQHQLDAVDLDERAALAAYFDAPAAPGTRLLLEAAAPRSPWVRYLLGRALVQAGELPAGAAALEATLSAELPAPLLAEAQRLAVEAAARAGDCAGADRLAAALPPTSKTAQRRAADWLAWCRFTPPNSP